MSQSGPATPTPRTRRRTRLAQIVLAALAVVLTPFEWQYELAQV